MRKKRKMKMRIKKRIKMKIKMMKKRVNNQKSNLLTLHQNHHLLNRELIPEEELKKKYLGDLLERESD